MAAAEPMLVFAHYFGGSSRSWDPLVAEGLDFGCAAPDLPGFGGTAVPSGHLDLELYADHLEAVAGGGPWVAVGHSMGGKIALAAAARAAPGLQAMILIAPSPPTPEPMSEEERRKSIGSFGDAAAARAHIQAITGGSLIPDVVEHCVEDQLRSTRRAWLWWLEEGSRQDISARTAGLELPTLVIGGSHDVVLGLAAPFKVASGLRCAEVQVVSGAGHLAPLEQPAALAGLIRRFLAEQAL